MKRTEEPEIKDWDCPKCNEKMVYIRAGIIENKTPVAICKKCRIKYAVGWVYLHESRKN